MLNIFFSRPNQLDRFTRHELSDEHCLAYKIKIEPASTEAAAEMDFMDFDVANRRFCGLRRRGGSRLAVLRRSPDVNATVFVQSRAVLRLHGRVFKVGRII